MAGGRPDNGARSGVRARLRGYQDRAESAVTRILLLAIFVTGLVAQFVKPVGDALQDKVFLGSALFSLVGYVLYDAVRDLSASSSPQTRTVVNSRDLGQYVSEAFAARHVTVRFLGYTGETLFNELYHRLERLLDEPRQTRSVSIRIMAPDFSVPMIVPSRVGPDGSPADDPDFRRRLQDQCQNYERMLNGLADRLRARGRVTAEFEYRLYQGIPRDKICIFNGELVLHGLYDVEARTRFHSPDQDFYDPKGYNTDLQVWSRREGTAEAEAAVEMWVKHYDGLWKLAPQPSWRPAPGA